MGPPGAAPSGGAAADAAWEEAMLAAEGPLSVEQALEALQLPPSARGDAEAARAAYRRLSVRWHPDKNAGQEARAQALFVRVAAAYNTLTTVNFDYTRWAESYVVPSMQTLEDVLLLAMKGEDPFVIDAMLRKRGDYRPHQQFGVDLAVPWSAGTQETPSWEVVGAQHTTTRALPAAGASDSAGALALIRRAEFCGDDFAADPSRLAGASAARPWERVGGIGFQDSKGTSSARDDDDDRAPPSVLRPELEAGAAGAAAAAEAANDAGLLELSRSRTRAASECFAEAFRLRPDAAAYAANEAAAQLARGRHAAAAAAARAALALEADHWRAAQRLGQAALALGEAAADAGRGDRGKALLREAKAAFALALKLQPGAAAAVRGAKQAALAWAAEFDSDEE